MERTRLSLLVVLFFLASLACSSGGSLAPGASAPYQEEEEEPEFDEPDHGAVLRGIPPARELDRGSVAAGPRSLPARPSFAWAFYMTARDGRVSDLQPRLLFASNRTAGSRSPGTAHA